MFFRQYGSALKLGLRLGTFFCLLAAAALLPQQLPQGLDPSLAVFRLAPPLLTLPEVQVQMLFSSQESLRRDALALTAKALAERLQPELAGEQWNIQALRLPLQAGAQPEEALVAVALSLAPEQGYLCLLEPGRQGYTFFYAEKNLLPIKHMASWPFAASSENHLPPELIALWEDHDETMGAFSSVERFSLWLWHNNKLQQVFQTNTRWQLSFPQEKIWITARQQYQIKGRDLSLEIEGYQEYFEGAEPALRRDSTGNLKPLPSLGRTIRQQYTFYPAYLAFGIGEGAWRPKADSNSIPVLLLQDLAQELEAPFYSSQHEYLVKTLDGATAVVPASQLVMSQ